MRTTALCHSPERCAQLSNILWARKQWHWPHMDHTIYSKNTCLPPFVSSILMVDEAKPPFSLPPSMLHDRKKEEKHGRKYPAMKQPLPQQLYPPLHYVETVLLCPPGILAYSKMRCGHRQCSSTCTFFSVWRFVVRVECLCVCKLASVNRHYCGLQNRRLAGGALISAGVALMRAPPMSTKITGTKPDHQHYSTSTDQVHPL